MKKYIFTTMMLIASVAFGHTLQERVELAAQDTGKIAELMPEKQDERAKFKEGLFAALETMPAFPKEREAKISEAKKVFADLEASEQAAKLLVIPAPAPATFTGVMALDLTSTNSVASTNLIWVLDEIDMDYGLDRKPRTMDKTKKYYPGWRRGEEPGGYPCQTIH